MKRIALTALAAVIASMSYLQAHAEPPARVGQSKGVIHRSSRLAGPFVPLGLSSPAGVAVDAHGNIYVADQGNSRIVKLSHTGQLLDTWHLNRHDPAQVTEPADVAVDSAGNVYVVYWNEDGVQKLSPSGKLLAQFPTGTSNRNGPAGPTGVTLDRHGHVWVALIEGVIDVFTTGGKLLRSWHLREALGNDWPPDIAVDRQGHIYLTDPSHNRILVYSASGKELSHWGGSGKGGARFRVPTDLAVDKARHVYVVDTGTNRVLKLSASGRLLRAWKSGPFTSGQDAAFGITVDQQSRVYVTTESQVQRFSSSGRLLDQWG